MNNIYEYFKQLYNENILTQSFLIGNAEFDDVKIDIEKVINDFIFCSDVKIEENPDVYILKNNDKIISKDDITELLNNVYKTSQFNSKKIYIIENCEKLNDFSCNALLKTLEEPPENVYAILLTSNIDSVLPTISSRCQKIFVSATIKNESEDNSNICYNIINSIEKNGVESIALNYDIYSLINDRIKLISVLKQLLNIYNDSLRAKINNIKEDNIIIENNSIEEISKKILVINDTINKLNYYLNKNITIDRFIIEMWRCKDENSWN